jgi:23S rRNA (cytosine1962-C5)-methyltransferase
MYPIITLKPGRETSVYFHHPWVFSGALKKIPADIDDGALVHLADEKGEIIATGTYSNKSIIAARIFEMGKKIIDADWFRSRIYAADELRRFLGYGNNTDTTGYRLLFGESDRVPGLVIDRYDKALVFQISTVGTDAFRSLIVELLAEIFKPEIIVERSDLISRREEGLDEIKKIHFGQIPEPVLFSEYGLVFAADIWGGQKTGFFLDQKETRKIVRNMAANRSVLNLFSYTGSMGTAAIKGGAVSVHNVDSSEEALKYCHLNGIQNNIDNNKISIEEADVFAWLSDHDKPAFDMVIIDPPALIKSQSDINSGKKAYHFLNRAALRLINNGGLLISSSCSAFFKEEDFIVMLRRASIQTGTRLDILSLVRQSQDHPISFYFPESAYLKTFICRVSRPL